MKNNKSVVAKPIDGPLAHNEEDFDALAQNLRQIEGVSDDVALIIAHSWKKIIGGFAVVLLIVWLGAEYRASKQADLGLAAEKFIALQKAMEDDLAGDSSEVESANAASENSDSTAEEKSGAADKTKKGALDQGETVASLKSDYSALQYGKLGSLYDVLLAVKRGDYQDSPEKLAALKAEILVSSDNKALTLPLVLLVDARVKALSGKKDEARTMFLEIASGGSFVSVEAMLAAVDFSETDDQLHEALKTAQGLRAAHPEFADLLDEGFSERGMDIDSVKN
ncbi:MAG: hypothetical protein PHC51_01725 [bacterium]|nr:hypothetical protein [bacterium]